MQYKKHKLTGQAIPDRLQSIPQAPKALFFIGSLAGLAQPKVAIVGSRKVTPYGRQVTTTLVTELIKHGVAIVSGLALGVDSIAHQTTVEQGGRAIAILPTDVEHIYPARHNQLAMNILKQGGLIISEHENQTDVYKPNFVTRNRLISGLADVTIIIEAAAGSGSLHTARFAKKQNRKIRAVPGPITSPQSTGTNDLIKNGVPPLTSAQDILEVLGLASDHSTTHRPRINNKEQRIIYNLIRDGVHDVHELQRQAHISPALFQKALTMLELAGYIVPTNNDWYLQKN